MWNVKFFFQLACSLFIKGNNYSNVIQRVEEKKFQKWLKITKRIKQYHESQINASNDKQKVKIAAAHKDDDHDGIALLVAIDNESDH